MLADIYLVRLYDAFVNLFGPLGLMLAIVIAIVTMLLMLYKPAVKALFIVFIFVSLFSSSSEEAVARTLAINILQYFLLFPIALWGLFFLLFGKNRIGSVGILLFIYTLVSILSFVVNGGIGVERLIAQLLLYCAVIGFISEQVTNIEELKEFLAQLGYASWLVLAIAISFIIVSPSSSFLAGRLTSLWHRPNAFAIMLFFLLLPLGYRAFFMPKNYFRLIDISGTIASLLMIILTGTRSAALGGTIILLPLLRGRSKVYLFLGFFLVIIVAPIAMQIPAIQEMVSSRFLNTSDVTASGRMDIWASAWDRAMQRPLLGYGPGEASGSSTTMEQTFNSYLSIAVEGGFTSLFIFILALFAALVTSITGTMQLDGPDRRLGGVLIFAVVAIGIICLFESIASGIGGGGVVLVWTILQLTTTIRPARDLQSLAELDYALQQSDVFTNEH